MALNAQNVRVAVTGGIYRAPLVTTLPTNATTALAGDFDELGYASEEGITQSVGRDVSDIAAWQNGDVVRVVQTSHTVTYQFNLIETSGLTLETAYGNYEDLGGGAGVTEITGALFPHYVWALHVVDGDSLIRLVLPDGQVTETGDVTLTNGELITYPITVTAFPDTDGVKVYKYTSNPVASA